MFDTILSIDLRSPLLVFAHTIILTVDKMAALWGVWGDKVPYPLGFSTLGVWGLRPHRYKKSLGLGLAVFSPGSLSRAARYVQSV